MIKEYLQQHQQNILDRLFESLRMKSISSDPIFYDECIGQAHWFKDLLSSWGFDTEIFDPGTKQGLPAVFAQNEQIENRPTVLFYGHYDVQPDTPLKLWDSDPFEPVIKETNEGKSIFARGANDDKGQLFTFLEATQAMLKFNDGELGLNLKIFLEGEEESGSPSLEYILNNNQQKLKADIIIISDADMHKPNQPAFTTSLRGMSSFDITIKGAKRDLHSGLYSPVVVNPALVMSRILGKMIDDDGHITINGFYDNIAEISHKQKQQWEALNDDALQKMYDVGVSQPAGERSYSAIEQNWSRPTIDINGLTSGYQDEGGKTIIPSWARVKLSCRLVKGQAPDAVYHSVIQFFQDHLPDDCSLETKFNGGGVPYLVDPDDLFIQKAKSALDNVFDKPCLFIGCGASVPATAYLSEAAGGAPVIIGGWGQPSDAIHAPNENYSLNRFFKGIEGFYSILEEFKKG